jgi:hypothetical protein
MAIGVPSSFTVGRMLRHLTVECSCGTISDVADGG